MSDADQSKPTNSAEPPATGPTLYVAPSPHTYNKSLTTRSMMVDVLIALVPVVAMSVIGFGWRAVLVLAVCVASCLVAEGVFTRLRGRTATLGDCSAAVTGVILGLSLPATVPWWVAIIGSMVAIAIGKLTFGSLGQNLFNPAMVGRAFVMISFSKFLGAPAYQLADASGIVSMATPLTVARDAAAQMPGLWPLFLGTVNGSLGETSGVACLLGGLYLCLRRTASWEVPLGMIGAVAVLGLGREASPEAAYEVLDLLEDLYQKLEQADALGSAIQEADREAEGFARDVTALVALAAADLGQAPVEQAAEQLHARLRKAEQDAARPPNRGTSGRLPASFAREPGGGTRRLRGRPDRRCRRIRHQGSDRACFSDRPWAAAERRPPRCTDSRALDPATPWKLLGVVGAAGFLVTSLAALKLVPPLEDHDMEVRGTAYGLVSDFKPYFLTNRELYLPMAHPLLFHAQVAESLVLTGEIDAVRPSYESAREAEAATEPTADVAVAALDGAPDLGEREAVGEQRVRIDLHLVLADVAADARDLRDARDRLQLVAEVPVLDGAEIRQIVTSGPIDEGVLVDPPDARRVGTERGRDAPWQASGDEVQGLEHAAPCPVEIGPVLEDDVDE